MIPHSLPGDEALGNDLRNRVTACRKRVRRNRVMQKSNPVRNRSERILRQPISAPLKAGRYTEEYEIAVSTVEEHEVGIT